MKTFLKLAIAGAAFASSGAYASFASPTGTTGGDLILFIQDTALSNTTYALDTGVALNTILPSSAGVPIASYTGPIAKPISPQVNITADANLQTFLSTHAADLAAGKLQWAIEAGSYNALVTGNAAQALGAERYATTGGLTGLQGVSQVGSSQLVNSYFNITNDVQALNAFAGPGDTACGSCTSTAPTGDGAWGTSNGISGNQNWYGAGPDTTGIFMSSTASSSQELYGLMTGGKNQTAEIFDFGAFSLSSTGTLTSAPVSSVPLPAAVWLFGSGLLGLVGVGRRRSVTAA